MDINLLSTDFQVRKLDENDVDVIYSVSRKNKIFYQYHPPFVTKESIKEDIEALPPNKSFQDKYYIGFFNHEILVAVMDLILSYPTEETAFIGLFMMNAEYQGKGIGTQVLKDIMKLHKNQTIHIQYFKQNPVGKLYERLGFVPDYEKDYHYVMIKPKDKE